MRAGALDRVGRVLRAVGHAELAVAIAAFLATCGVVGANALLRYAFNSSLVWSEEVALLATNVFVFVGAAVIMKARADIAVSLVLARLRPAPRTLVRIATQLATVAFFGCLLAAALSLWPLQRNSTTLILDINRYWFTLPLAWAALSMLVTGVYQAAVTLAGGEFADTRLQLLNLPGEPE
jgi:TRAP-type C4-dicarboxylate transport system permease small subunit